MKDIQKHIKTIIIIIFTMVFKQGFAQTKTIKGTIIDTYNLPVESAPVVLYDTDKNIVTYSVTNEDGFYELDTETLTPGFFLKVSHLSFKVQEYAFKAENIQELNTVDFILEDNADALDEVIIVSSNKVKDTVKLDLEKLNLYEDDNLKEILTKIPNFRLSDDGTIIYKGKNINKVLVNNKPSFVNQNSIALESIENKIIEGISIFNNYNDDFTIDFDDNQESVLNIDTKKESQNIFNGSVEGKYGYQNKYEFKGKGLLFSKNLNAFLTNNTNNIGKTTITSNEIRKLFNEGQPFSPYQGQALGQLFSRNENLQKDFFTSTNITLRNQTQRLKTSGILYYIAPNRLNSIIQNTGTLDNVSLLNTQEQTKSKTQSFLGAFLVAYKLSNNSILTYNINANYIDNTNRSNINNQLFQNETISGTNTITSNNLNDIFTSYHQLALKSKLQKSLISETRFKYYNENSKLLNDYTINNQSILTKNEQQFKFSKQSIEAETALKYKFSKAFIPSLSLNYTNTADAIKDRNQSNTVVIDRILNNYKLNFNISGRKILKKLNYDVAIGLQSINNKIRTNNSKEQTIFVPIKASIDYENKLNRYYVDYARSNRFNDLQSGINTIQPFNTNWIGNIAFPLAFNTTNSIKAGYNYDNLFDAKLFSISLGYENQKNTVRRRFVQQQNGVSDIVLFIADKSTNFNASSFYSKTVFAYKYPTKIDFGVRYNLDSYPIQNVDVKTNNIAPELKLETITDRLLNFRFSSKISFINDKVGAQKYNSTYTNNAFAVLLKNRQWKGALSFLLDNNRINGINYSRKNLNFELSHTKNKTTFSIEARHLGELLDVFKNDSYNSQFVIRDGIINTIVNDQSLNYIILGIKYKL
ncbi:carboxypeptidase-like regulatory domain-containing protein [uncultured Lacinutrix sp.]|uniref:carboxypeptidase-like regulatory domain-containing protein n=1 Tax=uncultured Lacinutrix sp. TaxID=574032 RepID=UPI00262CF101|nr:carboxypeptidase-like regulatory domain-containing protein [uncultured Lacinutrix sp.]